LTAKEKSPISTNKSKSAKNKTAPLIKEKTISKSKQDKLVKVVAIQQELLEIAQAKLEKERQEKSEKDENKRAESMPKSQKKSTTPPGTITRSSPSSSSPIKNVVQRTTSTVEGRSMVIEGPKTGPGRDDETNPGSKSGKLALIL